MGEGAVAHRHVGLGSRCLRWRFRAFAPRSVVVALRLVVFAFVGRFRGARRPFALALALAFNTLPCPHCGGADMAGGGLENAAMGSLTCHGWSVGC